MPYHVGMYRLQYVLLSWSWAKRDVSPLGLLLFGCPGLEGGAGFEPHTTLSKHPTMSLEILIMYIHMYRCMTDALLYAFLRTHLTNKIPM